MTLWLDVTTTMNWDRPPVGIVRTEIEIIKAALERDDVRFFVFRGRAVKAIETLMVKTKIEILDKPRQENNSLARIEKGRVGNLQANISLGHLRQMAQTRISRLKPKNRFIGMSIALRANALLEGARQTPGFVKGVRNHLHMQLRYERNLLAANRQTVLVDPLKTSKDPIPNGHICPPSCPWAVFNRGDSVMSAGLLWDFADLNQLHSEAQTHGFSFMAVCFDIIPIKFPHLVPDGFADKFLQYIGDLLWAADHVICISESTKRDLQELASTFGMAKEIAASVAYLGDSFQEMSPVTSESLPQIKGKFILYVSTIEKRKNHALILKVIEKLGPNFGEDMPTFVFVGMPGWHVEELYRDLALNPLMKRPNGSKIVTLLSNVTDSELIWLYQNAEFTVFPSLYEGWGLPVAESLYHGTPVISADSGALLEASQGRATHLDPNDLVSWVRAIELLLRNPEVREQAILLASDYKPRDWKNFTDEVFFRLNQNSSEEFL